MKVIHNCSIYEFHKQYCLNIHNELLRRGHTSIIETMDSRHDNVDFTIQPDENSKNLGGRGIWVGHAFPVVPQNKFYLEEISYRKDAAMPPFSRLISIIISSKSEQKSPRRIQK